LKKILVVATFLFFCFIPFSVMAQHNAVDKGSFELGIGSIVDIWLYSWEIYEDATWIGLGTTPNLTVGYFVANGFMVGTTIGFTRYKSESWTDPNNYFSVQPIVKYYFPFSEKFLLNGKVFFGWSRDKTSGDPDAYTRINFGGGVAGTYMLLPSLGASIGVDFIAFLDQKYGGETIDDSNVNIFYIILGLSVYL